MLYRKIVLNLGFLLIALISKSGTAADIIGLGTLPELPQFGTSIAHDVSADGSVVVGRVATSRTRKTGRGFRWTVEGGMQVLPLFSGAVENNAEGVSADGLRVASDNKLSDESTYEGTLWESPDSVIDLGGASETLIRFVEEISGDGLTVVGSSPAFGEGKEAVRWREETGIESLGVSGIAYNVSYDGTRIVGQTDSGVGWLWDESTGITNLRNLGGQHVLPWYITHDGTTVVGQSDNAQGSSEPFIWTDETGIQPFEGWDAWSQGASGGGGPIASNGSFSLGWKSDPDTSHSFIWDEQSGFRDLKQFLSDEHELGPQLDNWHSIFAWEISADATTIVGSAKRAIDSLPEAFVVQLDRPLIELHQALAGDYNNNGTVEQADLDLVLLNWGEDAADIPEGWMSNLPTGTIDQDELDDVLLNWGNSAAIAATNVPEPSTLALLLATLAVSSLRRKRMETG